MRTLLLYFVVALFAWMGFALFGGSGDTPLAPGFLLLMAALSVVLWDRFVAPRQVASATHVSAATPRVSATRTIERAVSPRPAAPPVPLTTSAAMPPRLASAGPNLVWRPLAS